MTCLHLPHIHGSLHMVNIYMRRYMLQTIVATYPLLGSMCRAMTFCFKSRTFSSPKFWIEIILSFFLQWQSPHSAAAILAPGVQDVRGWEGGRPHPLPVWQGPRRQLGSHLLHLQEGLRRLPEDGEGSAKCHIFKYLYRRLSLFIYIYLLQSSSA